MKLYGKPLDERVVAQLNYRRNNLLAKEKSLENIDLDNNRGAFVQLCSGATEVFYASDETKVSNLSRYPDLKKNDDISVSNVLAQSNILLGGTLYRKSLEEGKYDTLLRGGVNINQPYSEYGSPSAYEVSEIYGFRPMMGITDLSILHKGPQGAIREANIKITANSPEQLTILDKLYFRPGYAMLLEWGNNTYYDDEGIINSFQKTFHEDFLQFDASILKIKSKIVERRIESGYNYDGMIGRVTNFQWGYKDDGTYDCSIKLLSEGDVIEGFRTTFKKPDQYWTDQYSDNDQNDTGDTYDDVLIKELEVLKNNAKKDEILNELKNRGITDARIYKIPLEKSSKGGEKRNNAFYYIPMSMLFQIINRSLLQDQDSGSISVSFDSDPLNSTMITFTGHVSARPDICVMPYRPGKAGGFDNTPTEMETYLVTRKKDIPKAILDSGDDLTEDNQNSPMKILLNVDFLINIQSELIKQESDDADNDAKLARFINTLFGKVNGALGEVNKLKTLFDKDTNIYTIIDQNLIDSQKEPADILPLVDVVGLGSFATNVSIESKISTNTFNMLSVAATAQGSSFNKNMEGILKYNRGITDRFSIGKKSNSGKTAEEKNNPHRAKTALEESKKNAIKALGKGYRKLDKGIFAASLFTDATIPHRKYTNALYEYIQLRTRGEGRKKPFSGLLPIELSIELRGITGFLIGEAFTISPEVLPERYRNKIGFTVTGIDHKIGADNQWSTAIKTQMYNLPSDEIESLGTNFDKLEPVKVSAIVKEIKKEAAGSGGSKYTPHNQPWSAAFISHVALAGDSSFPTSRAHTGYADKIRKMQSKSGDAESAWRVLDGKIYSPKKGDILIQGREGNKIEFVGLDGRYSGKSHGDLVTFVKHGERFQVIGGNVSNTVVAKNLTQVGKTFKQTDGSYRTHYPAGKSKDASDSTRQPYNVILRPNPKFVNINAMVAKAKEEWNFWHPDAKTPLSEANKKDKEGKANETDARGEELFARLADYWESAGLSRERFGRDVKV